MMESGAKKFGISLSTVSTIRKGRKKLIFLRAIL